MNSLDKAEFLDQNDPLSRYRNRFFHPENEIYFDGNSLGKMPIAAQYQLHKTIDEQWGKGLIGSWNNHWIDLPSRIAKKYSQLLGAKKDEIIIGESTSVRLYQSIHALLESNLYPKQLVTDTLNFPSDLYILDGLTRIFKIPKILKLDYSQEIEANVKKLKNSIKESPGIICLSLVSYKSSYLYPMKELNEWANNHRSIIVWDLSHAVGAVPIDFKASATLIAIGCTYKYMNGGPGAPAFLFIEKKIQTQIHNPIQGWFGHQNPFNFSDKYIAANDINKFASGTPSVLSMQAMEAGIDIILEAGIKKIREKSILQSENLIDLVKKYLVPNGFHLESPRNSLYRGSHITLSHKSSWQICQTLISGNGNEPRIIPDFRPPNFIRFGITPLYTKHDDIYQLVKRLEAIVKTKSFLSFTLEKPKVT